MAAGLVWSDECPFDRDEVGTFVGYSLVLGLYYLAAKMIWRWLPLSPAYALDRLIVSQYSLEIHNVELALALESVYLNVRNPRKARRKPRKLNVIVRAPEGAAKIPSWRS